ncbi:DUF4283 domain-containing protein [Senna tora]|uniref:DUF4283 domain-containing protein n=1 Tax=Senna tora TaxID=362788 RepID=A0A834XHC1_9FABA|nr:DUF4283 domain-containing protein [Senna tora]
MEPNPHVEFFKTKILIKIGNSLGTFLGIDEYTHNLVLAQYAQICILANMSDNLPLEIKITTFTMLRC